MKRISTKRQLIDYVADTRNTAMHGPWKAKGISLLCNQLWRMTGIKEAKCDTPFFGITAFTGPEHKQCYVVTFYNTGITAGTVSMHFRTT